MITDPTGVLEPAYLGQHFYDADSNIFYQARGRTPADWHFVPPDDFVGSFVKIYDQFVGIPYEDDQTPDGIQHHLDGIIVRETMKLSGVELMGFGGLYWKTAKGVSVYQIRLKFTRTEGLSVFAGFTNEARSWAMPSGIGLSIEDGIMDFGPDLIGSVYPRNQLLIRFEVGSGLLMVINGEHKLAMPSVDLPPYPVLALFDRATGDRPTSPGYAMALKRNMERKS